MVWVTENLDRQTLTYYASRSLNLLSCFPVPLPSPKNLQKVQVPIVANSKCQQINSDPISDNKLCAGGEGRGVCVSVQNTKKRIVMCQGPRMSQTRSQLVHQI